MPPHWQRGWDAPSANAHKKTKIQTHVLAIVGAAFSLVTFSWPFKRK